jgi:diacylglycerol O-acyltransferase / wax synthase
MTEFMRNTDAFALGMEEDARLRSTVVTILTLDRSPDWDVLVDRLERVSRLMPMFRQRVVPTTPPAPPRWVYDKDFDLRFHLRRVMAPAPGTFETVLEMARNAEMGEFDHSRPMWTATLIEGLVDGAAAIVVKMHHSLADGIGGMQIAALVFDFQPEPADLGPLPRIPSPTNLLPLDGVRRSLEYDVGLTRRLVRGAAVGGAKLLVSGAVHPRSTLRTVWSTTTSVYRTVRPINHTASPIMLDRRLIRELGVHEVPLSTLKEAGRRAGGSLNDAFLAGVTGGLRRYHERHGAAVDELVVTMPISIRMPGDSEGGNRITLVRLPLPVGESDPHERIGEIRERALAARNEPSLKLTQDIAGGLNLLPRWYIGAILRHVDFLASNVPGTPVPVWVGGAAVTMQYAFGPTIGAGVNITLITYQDTCALAINADSGAVPDLPVFRECLVEGFEEVLALGLEPDLSAPPGRPRKKGPARTPTPIA